MYAIHGSAKISIHIQKLRLFPWAILRSTFQTMGMGEERQNFVLIKFDTSNSMQVYKNATQETPKSMLEINTFLDIFSLQTHLANVPLKKS